MFPLGKKEEGAYATAQARRSPKFRRQGSRYRHRPRHRRFRRSTMDREGWQRRSGEAESVSQRSEKRWRSLGLWNGAAEAVASGAADTSLGAFLASQSRAAKRKSVRTINAFRSRCQGEFRL